MSAWVSLQSQPFRACRGARAGLITDQPRELLWVVVDWVSASTASTSSVILPSALAGWAAQKSSARVRASSSLSTYLHKYAFAVCCREALGAGRERGEFLRTGVQLVRSPLSRAQA